MNYSDATMAAYHRPATAANWSELKARLDEAVREGRLSQAQCNKILSHIEQRHYVNN